MWDTKANQRATEGHGSLDKGPVASAVRCLPVQPSSRPRYDYAAWSVLLLRLVRLLRTGSE